MESKIDLLRNHPHFIPKVVDLLWDEWKDDYLTLSKFTSKQDLTIFYSRFSDSIPVTYIIYADPAELIGVACVDIEDMGIHPECSPWLDSVLIAPEYRGHGYASKLITYVIDRYPVLHLWTFNEQLANLYTKFGFVEKERIAEHGSHKNIIYMVRDNQMNL